jgi:hypothetical protein
MNTIRTRRKLESGKPHLPELRTGGAPRSPCLESVPPPAPPLHVGPYALHV